MNRTPIFVGIVDLDALAAERAAGELVALRLAVATEKDPERAFQAEQSAAAIVAAWKGTRWNVEQLAAELERRKA